jgi:cell division protein FtsZ
MDFHSFTDSQMGSNEEQAMSQSENNESQNSVPVNLAATSAEGFPVRWDFKSVLKQDEFKPAADVSSELVNTPAVETTGDTDFDNEWAELIAKEEAEKQSKFIEENQITAIAESEVEETTVVNELAGTVEHIELITAEAESVNEAPEIVWVNVAQLPLETQAEISSEPVSEFIDSPVAEIVDTPVAEFIDMPSSEFDFADMVEENSMQSSNEEFTAEVISETLEAIGLEPAFEINISPVSESAETVISDSVNETESEVEVSREEFNTIMSESENTIFNEEFQPIELASEPELSSETVAPVFVSVEHSWMYAEQSAEPVAEAGEMQVDFNSSLPGELPLFESAGAIIMETEIHTHNNHKSEEAMKFELPEYSSIIKVIGVGGGGSNAVNHMYKLGIKGVDFLVCNTDKQALDLSPVPHKVVLGTTLTEGRGAGSIPEVGRNAAIENIEDLRSILSNNTKMVFITAGMGGGTGTGAAPVIAGVARELGILTVGIVTVPFTHEGKKRRQYAEEGIEMLKQNVDTLLVIRNDKLREMYGNLKLSDAFAHADDVLSTAAKSIAEIISLTQQINVDFADICTVMRNSGVAIMGSANASGENRAVRAVEMSLNSPLLNDNNIIGARYVLLNIISGADEITMDELGEITDFIQEAAGQTAEIIKGYGVDPSLGDSVSVTIIATGFQQTNPVNYEYAPKSQPEKVVRLLDETKVVEVPKVETVQPVAETEVNPLEPFLVSKTETVTETVTETKTEWSAPAAVEFEIVNTSQEITEPVSSLSDFAETTLNEITSSANEEKSEEEVPEPVLVVKQEVKAELDPQEAAKKAEQEEIQRRANERIQKLRDISLKLKSPQVLNEMENEPAYKRRNVNLENVPHSSESQVSRFTLTENEEKKIEIRPNNSFLHDNVD